MAESAHPNSTDDLDQHDEGHDFEKDLDDLDIDFGPRSVLDPSVLGDISELQPKLDTIFADVQCSIPSLDFEASSVSSDEELSIFSRSLKTPLSDRDPTEDSLTPEAWRRALEPSNEIEDIPVQAPTYEYIKLAQETNAGYRSNALFKSSMPSLAESEGGEATSPRVFNRRLMSTSSSIGSDDGKPRSHQFQDLVPRDLIPSIDDFDDTEDALAHSGGSFGNNSDSLGHSTSSLQTVISSVVAESLGFDDEDHEQRDISTPDEGIVDVNMQPHIPHDKLLKRGETQANDDNRNASDNRQETLTEEDQVLNEMLPSEVPTLDIEKVDFIDLDLLIDAFPERSNLTETSGDPPSGKGDANTDSNCLMERLTQLCIDQSGGSISKADLSPSPSQQARKKRAQGFAAKPPRPPPKIVWEDKTSPTSVGTSTSTSPHYSNGRSPPKLASTGTSTSMDHSIVEVGENKPRVVGLQRSTETVYLDLRPKEAEEETTDGPSTAVQRILQLHSKQADSGSSDDSSDDEDSALGWHEKRRKVIQKLAQQQGGHSPLTSSSGQPGERETARDKEPMRKSVSTPHRVIHMVHDEESDRRESSTQTAPSTQMDDTSRAHLHLQLPPTPPQSPASQGSRTPQRRLSLTDAPLTQGTQTQDPGEGRGMEGQKERGVALAARLREQKEKERQRRLKLQRKLEALRPQMTTSSKKKEIAKATDIIFDFEASYKPESALLPPSLGPAQETVLLTVTMATSGSLVLNKSSGRQPLDRVDSGQLSATHTVLLSWLLSLVPRDMAYLTDQTLDGDCSASGQDTIPFRVVGIQQVWKEGKLQLQVAITPSCMDTSKLSPVKPKRGKLRDEVRDMTPFQQSVSRFLTSRNLHTVAPWLPRAFCFTQGTAGEPLELPPTAFEANREGVADSGAYVPPYPLVSSKPFATYVTLVTAPCAVENAFTAVNTTPGFFWRTLDTDESVYDQLTNEEYGKNVDTQNTLTLLHESVYQYPARVAGVLYRLVLEGLDISGLRLVYNSTDLLASPRQAGRSGKEYQDGGPILVAAIRGSLARTRWLDAVGPSDPQLAKRTDPYSLMALYGGISRDDLTIICPRNPNRINYELSLWFGARGASEERVKDALLVGEDRRGRSESPKQKKKKRGNSKDSWSSSSNEDLDSAGVSPAALTATTCGDVVLGVSPLVPPMCLGMIFSACQERGYQLRGVRRLRLNSRRAAALGLQGKQVAIFSPMSCSTPTSPKNCEEALRKRLEAGLNPASTAPPLPSTLIHLRAENALRNAASLIQHLMVQLSRQDLLPSIQASAEANLRSSLCFHATPYTDNLLSALGGDFSRIPEHDVYHGASVPSTFYSNPELEQIVVVTFSGAKMLRLLGNTLGKLLGVFPVTSTNNLSTPRASPGEGLELLGIKFLPSLTAFQAKELTPFEVGDRSWQASVHSLVSNPAVVCVLRGINAFHHVRSLLKIPTHPNDFRQGAQIDLCMERLMSASAEIAFRQATMFFRDHELYADPSMRANLPYQPPLRSPSLEELSNARFAWAEEHGAGSKKSKQRTGSGAQTKGTVLVEESIIKTMLAGPRPITTVLIIKPGALKHLSKILKRVSQEDFITVAMRLVTLTAQQARALVPDRDAGNTAVTAMHLDHLGSGPNLVLVLQRENAVRKLLSVLGPANPKEAKKKSEFLWRGMFGADPINNGLHGSATYAKAVEEQTLFFPEGLCCRLTSDLKADKICCPAVDPLMGHQAASSRTFMLGLATPTGGAGDSPLSSSGYHLNGALSPRNIGVGTSTADLTLPSHSALCQTNCILLTPPLQLLSVRGHRKGYVDVIDCLRHRGFGIVGARMVWFNATQAKEFVSIYSGAFPNLVQLLCHGPSIVLAIQRDNAVSCLGSLLGNVLDKDSVINKYGKHILRPKDTKEAIKHLVFFFNELMPGSQGAIVSEDTAMEMITA